MLEEGKTPHQKVGIDSEQAAALIASEGTTMDAEELELAQNFLQLDELMRADITEQMGFRFKIKFSSRAIHVYSDDGTKLSTRAKLKPDEVDEYGNIVDPAVIDRLVDACLKLKEKWDANKIR